MGIICEDCCERKIVKGHMYVLVDENGSVPSNCTSSCVYELVHEPGSRYCFSPGEGESDCLAEGQIFKPYNHTDDTETEQRYESERGCPLFKDLPTKIGKQYVCAYSWRNKNLGAGGQSVTGCQGSKQTWVNNERTPNRGGFTPMGSIAVMPGCHLYMYSGAGVSGYTGQLKILSSGFVYQNNFGATGVNPSFGHGPTAHICECEQETISCDPTDGYDTIVTCDNTEGTVDTICTYQLTTGITRSNSLTAEQSISLTLKAEEEVTLEGIFKAGVSASFTTGFKWSESSTETFTASTTITVTDKAPAGKVLLIQQAVGHCAGRKVRTSMIRTKIQDRL